MHLDEKCSPILDGRSDDGPGDGPDGTDASTGQVCCCDPIAYAERARAFFEAGEQAGITLGLTLADRHDYGEGYAAGYAARQAELDAETADYLARFVDTTLTTPARDRGADRARRDRAMVNEGRRMERALQRERDERARELLRRVNATREPVNA